MYLPNEMVYNSLDLNNHCICFPHMAASYGILKAQIGNLVLLFFLQWQKQVQSE
jgi:hypothetical protein